MHLNKILLEFFKYILRLILLSVILFVVGLSLITQQFPPDFSKIRNFYDMYKYLKKTTARNSVVSNEFGSNNINANDDALSELLKHRENVSKILSDFNVDLKMFNTNLEPIENHLCLHEKSLIISLEDKIADLEKTNLRLMKLIKPK